MTENQNPVAKLVVAPVKQRKPRKPGNCKGMIALLVEASRHRRRAGRLSLGVSGLLLA
jgi:hypothetical protein